MKTKITLIVIIIFTAILTISSYILLKDFLEYNESEKVNMELIENVITEESKEEKITINWKELENINKDIVGWIKIQDTKIDYPILQDDDKLKYLKCSVDGKRNSNGSIFTINRNPFVEDITTIYRT